MGRQEQSYSASQLTQPIQLRQTATQSHRRRCTTTDSKRTAAQMRPTSEDKLVRPVTTGSGCIWSELRAAPQLQAPSEAACLDDCGVSDSIRSTLRTTRLVCAELQSASPVCVSTPQFNAHPLLFSTINQETRHPHDG
ncbi:hypothetical protein BLNAU_10742 [Blattamonas nauphoetae]|uniref:Uncharacterized protein n=1 Tax=Blattamonas nauphoetae TaxID=2049346 RepID=A0ABQ9XRT1_9EUKA|nr:hypothetical protein BLNAU_10742 [Blattamonas nauphoetae]